MRRLFILVIFLTFIIPAATQVKSSLFKNYTANEGLIDEKIHCVFQDSKGWIWVGTDYGVLSFDGYQFKQLRLDSRESDVLASSLIRKITEDSNGYIWIGTDFQGLFKYDRRNYELRQFVDKGLTHNSVWDILEDNDGLLWLGTESGLNVFDPKDEKILQRITTDNNSNLTGAWIRRLIFDDDGMLWVGTDHGITVINPDIMSFQTYLDGPGYEELENEVWDIFQDSEKQIWVGCYLGGLKKFDRESKEFVQMELDTENPRALTVRTIAQDRQGDLWFGTRGGLYSYDYISDRIDFYNNEANNPFSLVHNSVLNLLVDTRGDLWVGTRNGLSFLNFDKKAFAYLAASRTETHSLNNSEVYVIWESPEEEIWIGTESGGVNIYNSKNGRVRYLTTEDGLSQNCIKAILPDNDGNILIGTYLGGLNQYDPESGKVRIYVNDPDDPGSISGNDVWCIQRDSKGRLWVGTSEGLDLFDERSGTFTHYGRRYKLGAVSMIFEDSRENFWVYSSDIETLTKIGADQSVDVFNIRARAFCEDSSGNIWMASTGEGLLKYSSNEGTFQRYTIEDGLASNILHGLINVNDRYLWMSSNNGLSRFDLRDTSIMNYFSEDGLLNNKYNYGAYCRTSGNTLAFGGQHGVDFVFLDRLKENSYVPPLALTSFRIFNNEAVIDREQRENGTIGNFISESAEITLNHDQNMIAIDFAALNYANSDKNRYRYMLKGFDKDWNDIGNGRTATYTNLDHGDYIFTVVGSNNDGVYNETGRDLHIFILPPFWKTWIFRMIILTLLIGLLFALFMMIRNREMLKQQLIYERETARKIKEVDRIKHQFFMNISHEIRTPLSLITGPLDQALRTEGLSKSLETNLNMVKRNARSLTKLVNQLLDYRKLETGNLKLELSKGNFSVFIQRIVESFKAASIEKEISLVYKSQSKDLFFWFDSDKVEKMLNNLLSNAVKYSNTGGTISVALSSVSVLDLARVTNLLPALDPESSNFERYIKLRVTDDGIGIDRKDQSRIFDRFHRIKKDDSLHTSGSGIGLALTKEMIKLHHGHVHVKSKIDKGSQFTIYIPYDHYGSEDRQGIDMRDSKAKSQQAETESKDVKLALIVDDNPDLREFIRSHFEPGYKVLEAKNGKEAWNLALERVPNIIIADVMMPVMDGNELCKRIKKDERTSHIPLIMLSALGSNENQMAGIDSGADDYLTKPFDPGLLKAKVDNLLSIRRSLRDRFSQEMVLKPKDLILTSPDEKFLKRLIGLIEKNIDNDDLDVEFLSQNLDVSRTQLYRKIGALTDDTPKEFVRNIRLERAAQLLSQDSINISEIAYSIGFSDISYFRKCFKDKFGMSASEYRKKHH